MVSGQLSGMRACDARACGLNSCCVRRVLHACPGAASCIVTRGRGRRRWPQSLCEGPAPARAEGPGPATTPHLVPTLAGPLAFRGRAPGFETTPVVLRGDLGTEAGERRGAATRQRGSSAHAARAASPSQLRASGHFLPCVVCCY